MHDPSELSQRTHWELPSKVHSPCTKPDFLPPQSSSLLPLEQLVHGRGVSAPFAPSSCLCQQIPGLHSETVCCPVITSKLPFKTELDGVLGKGSPCSH